MAAETANELEGPSAAAPFLKQIRQRAFDAADWPDKVDAYVEALNSKEAMFNAIVDEHKFEFCGEFERKQALIRWNLLKTKLDEAKAKMYALRDRTGDYADVPATLYYETGADGESLVIYGLNRGENQDMSADFDSNIAWVTPTSINDAKIETIYTLDPNSRQFWPIWQVFIDGSNGQLVNDYGY
jgi:starch-binding outer membrane protein, SusD/RagB family